MDNNSRISPSICMKFLQNILLNPNFWFDCLIYSLTSLFLFYRNLKIPECKRYCKNRAKIDDVIIGRGDVIGIWIFAPSKVLGWTYECKKKFWILTIQLTCAFSAWDPGFQFSTLKKSMKMDSFRTFLGYFWPIR